MSKEYYIVKSITGCLGASGTVQRLKDRYTNKKKAAASCNKLKRANTNNHIIYWIDFNWT